MDIKDLQDLRAAYEAARGAEQRAWETWTYVRHSATVSAAVQAAAEEMWRDARGRAAAAYGALTAEGTPV